MTYKACYMTTNDWKGLTGCYIVNKGAVLAAAVVVAAAAGVVVVVTSETNLLCYGAAWLGFPWKQYSENT